MKNKKSLGQHWLYNRGILDEIAELAGEDGLCVEIGPGLGTLTSSLLKRFDKVLAVEFDEGLANNLPKSFPGKNLEVVNEDILKYDFSLINEPYVVAGNIPYYITSPIIEKLLTVSNLPQRVVLLIQKEVAERILDEKESVLSLFVKNRAEVFSGPVVLKSEFTPPPKVDSQVIVLEPKKPEVKDEVFKLIRVGFSAPRKKVLSNLSSLKSREELVGVFSKLGISLDARPADLGLETWQRLYEIIM
ncbi:ribosomal RNA small subunit methyltransferase A [Candidatus Saccharibacteria bacterium]|nr:ribosomal RNA small subunit methyltransferase A [Candidatus Saccharibacteria bacterium]